MLGSSFLTLKFLKVCLALYETLGTATWNAFVVAMRKLLRFQLSDKVNGG